jgi:hypothetical protein
VHDYSKETILHHYVFHRPETLRSTIVGNPIGPPGFHAVAAMGSLEVQNGSQGFHHAKHPVWL